MGPVSQGARAPPGGRNNNQRQQVRKYLTFFLSFVTVIYNHRP